MEHAPTLIRDMIRHFENQQDRPDIPSHYRNAVLADALRALLEKQEASAAA